MAVKYVVNTMNMAFQFTNGKVLDRKDVLIVEEKELEELEKDYMFASLKERGAISVSFNKPENLESAASSIAFANAELDAAKKEIADLKAKLAKAEALGKADEDVIDTNVDAPEVVEKKSKKKQ